MKQRKLRATLLRFDRTLSQDSQRQVLILLMVLAAIFMLSFLLLYLSGDDWIKYCEKNNINKWAFPFYLLVDGNAFNSFYTNDKTVVGGHAFGDNFGSFGLQLCCISDNSRHTRTFNGSQ